MQVLALSAALLFGMAAFAQLNPPADNNRAETATQITPNPNNTTAPTGTSQTQAPTNQPIQTAYGHHGGD